MTTRDLLAHLLLNEFEYEQLAYAFRHSNVNLHKVVGKERELSVTSIVLVNNFDRTREVKLFAVLSCGGHHDGGPCKCKSPTFKSCVLSRTELGIQA